MRGKKIIGWIACVVMLIATLFLPYTRVFAAKTVSESQASNDYDELALMQYYIQAADMCVPRLGNSLQLNISSTGSDNAKMRGEMRDYINLSFSKLGKDGFPGYTDTTLYSGYLEMIGQGKYKNGSVYCSQLGFDPATKLVEAYGVDRADLICGKDGKPGLFTIKTYYWSQNAWPTGWPATVDSYGETTDCRTALSKINFYLSNTDEKIDPGSGRGFEILFEMNHDFSFADFFADYTGNLSSVSNELLWAEQYRNFVNVCGAQSESKAQYEEALNNGATGHYLIYHNQGGNKFEEYWLLPSENKSRKTYANGSLSNSGDKKDCETIASLLASKAATEEIKDENKWKAGQVMDCYNTAVDNLEKLKDIKDKLAAIHNLAMMLVEDANTFKSNGYTPSYVDFGISAPGVPQAALQTFAYDYASGMRNKVNAIKQLANSAESGGLDDIVEITADFLSKARSYRDKGSLTDDEKTDFDGELVAYASNVGKFKREIYDKVVSAIDDAPDPDRLKGVVGEIALCLNGGGCRAVTMLESGVNGFFSFDEDDVMTCTLGDNMENVMDDVGEILGIEIDRDVYTPTEKPDPGVDDPSGPGGEDPVGHYDMKCANSGGAMSLGWIVCPILDLLGDASDKVYTKYVEPSLKVDAKLFTSGSRGIENGWGIFRGTANLVFIVLLLIVIISQLTGVGIDNYGIKKILPKLIIVAVLINMSYLICMICVDLSNIIGNTFQGIFNELSKQLPPPELVLKGDGAESIPPLEGIGSTAITGVVVLGSLVGMVGAIWANPAILLSLLVSALGIAISIFFLFILLSAREAAIVVMVVLAPLAMVCYTLPNTKKLFDKWLKLFEGLLLVYPICGLLVGGGNYVSTLLLSSGFGGGFITAFTSMIAGIVPIFFIPTVLKGSFAAMGNLGARISGLGERVRSGATRGIRNTDRFRAVQESGSKRRTRIRAGLDRDYKPTARGNRRAALANSRFGRAVGLASLQRQRIAAARKDEASLIEGDTMLRNLQMDYSNSLHPGQSTEAYLIGELNRVAAGTDDNAKFAVIDQMRQSNMQSSHIAQATRDAFGGTVQDKTFLEKFAKRYGNDFLRKDFEQADWARKGGVDIHNVNRALVAVGGPGTEWRKENVMVDDMKDDDVAALGSDRLYELMRDKKITQPQAQRVWASNSNMDDTSRLMLGVYGDDGTVVNKKDAQAALTGTYAGTASTLNKKKVDAFTERAATDVRIRDVEWRDKHGQHHQTDDLFVATRTGTGDEGSGTGDEGAGTGTEGAGTGTEGAGTGVEGAGTGTEGAGTGAEGAGTGTEGAGTGTEGAGTGTEGAGTGVEGAGTGTEGAGTGVEGAGTGTEGAGTGVEGAGTGSSGSGGSGGSDSGSGSTSRGTGSEGTGLEDAGVPAGVVTSTQQVINNNIINNDNRSSTTTTNSTANNTNNSTTNNTNNSTTNNANSTNTTNNTSSNTHNTDNILHTSNRTTNVSNTSNMTNTINSGGGLSGDSFTARGVRGDVTFQKLRNGRWIDDAGKEVEDFETFRRGVEEHRKSRGKK